jgi:hypothetical protein
MSAAHHEDLISRQVTYMQIAIFYYSGPFLQARDDDSGSMCALLLEPTGQNANEYKRIGFAEIPIDIGTGEGWEDKTITII